MLNNSIFIAFYNNIYYYDKLITYNEIKGMELNFIFFLELILQISVVVILGLGLWIINQQIKISNEHFKCFKILHDQLEGLQKTVENQYIWNKRSGALAYSLFKSDSLREAKIYLDKAFGNIGTLGTLDLKTIETKINKDPNLETYIQVVLGHWENMALAIDNGVADEDVAFSMVANQVKLYHNAFKEFIDDIREIYPQRYVHLINLYERWQRRLGGIESSNENSENN